MHQPVPGYSTTSLLTNEVPEHGVTELLNGLHLRIKTAEVRHNCRLISLLYLILEQLGMSHIQLFCTMAEVGFGHAWVGEGFIVHVQDDQKYSRVI